MNIFGIHVCPVEIAAALAAIPFVGICFRCLFGKYLKRKKDHQHGPH